MRTYEMMFILKPDLSEDDIAEARERLQTIIADFGGEFLKELDGWGKKRLAYSIEDYSEGIYAVWHFNGETGMLEILSLSELKLFIAVFQLALSILTSLEVWILLYNSSKNLSLAFLIFVTFPIVKLTFLSSKSNSIFNIFAVSLILNIEYFIVTVSPKFNFSQLICSSIHSKKLTISISKIILGEFISTNLFFAS
jgi:small subunit ribosomal protein S6